MIGIVIPCYKVRNHIGSVIAGIPPLVEKIYIIDDKCPENSGRFVEENIRDPRVRVIYHKENQGVGGAVITGFGQAVADSCDVVVKIDGDGQMNPELIPFFVTPITEGEADYTKGNRFFDIAYLRKMPAIRIIGNACVSFLSKLSSGYWDIFDPANGYIAADCEILKKLPLHKISRRYFFESDMLFRLNVIRAKVVDIPMEAVYGDEISGFDIRANFLPFMAGYAGNFIKRIFYNYYLRNFSIASVELVLGAALLLFGVVFGLAEWLESAGTGLPATAGTVMLSALPIIIGFQLVLAFLNYDINSVPKTPVSRFLRKA